MREKKLPNPPLDSIVDTLIAIGKSPKRVHRMVCGAAIDALDKLDAIERRRQAKADKWTKRGDRRPIEAVEKGKATVQKQRRQRSGARSSERRLAQRAEHKARLFPRETSATAAMLSALNPGRWYLRSEIRAACPELPEGTVGALLSRDICCPALLERASNPSWDGIRGSLRSTGADTSAERRSQWLYRLTAAGEAAQIEILADPTKWTAVERWKGGLENSRAVPQPHSKAAWPQLYQQLPKDRYHGR